MVLHDLTAMIQGWREKGNNHEIILMIDVNDYIEEKRYLFNFITEIDSKDISRLLNPEIDTDLIYGHINKMIDYMLCKKT